MPGYTPEPPPPRSPYAKPEVLPEYRTMEDPITRAQILALVKSGLSFDDVYKLLGLDVMSSREVMRLEWEYDPYFRDQCIEAMEDTFEPVMRHAIELSEDADVEGENEGSHKALALVMRHYDRLLDRKTKIQVAMRAAEAIERGDTGRSRSLVLGPEGVRALMAELQKEQPAIEAGEEDIEDIEIEEDDEQ